MKGTFFLIAGLVFLFSSCYTVINHPRVQDPDNPQYSHAVYFTDDCSRCHTNTEHFNIPVATRNRLPRVDYISQNERWNYFYEFPWWYRPLFVGTNGGMVADSSGNQPLPTVSARRRFPGAGGNSPSLPSGTVVSGGYTPGTIVGSTQKNNSGTHSQQGNSVQRQSAPKPGRKAIRGSGNSSHHSSSKGKIQRRKKK